MKYRLEASISHLYNKYGNWSYIEIKWLSKICPECSIQIKLSITT
jgi:hypothetical protein